MPVYNQAALYRLQHRPPSRKEHVPHSLERPNYGATQKFTKGEDTAQKLPPERILILQQITGTVLFYDKAIYLTILVALGKITATQTSGTIETEKEMQKLMDYCATYHNVTLRYKASGMVLKVHSDASYLLESLARSRAGGLFYMGEPNKDKNRPNGAIMVILTSMCNIMSSASVAECGALFYNAKELEEIRTTLIDMGHTQQATEIITDNYTAYGIMRGTIKKRTKSMDMRFYLVRYQVEQKHFEVKWKPGHMNNGDYLTKHHPPTHHHSRIQTYLVNAILSVQESILRGCVKTSNLVAGEHGA